MGMNRSDLRRRHSRYPSQQCLLPSQLRIVRWQRVLWKGRWWFFYWRASLLRIRRQVIGPGVLRRGWSPLHLSGVMRGVEAIREATAGVAILPWFRFANNIIERPVEQ